MPWARSMSCSLPTQCLVSLIHFAHVPICGGRSRAQNYLPTIPRCCAERSPPPDFKTVIITPAAGAPLQSSNSKELPLPHAVRFMQIHLTPDVTVCHPHGASLSRQPTMFFRQANQSNAIFDALTASPGRLGRPSFHASFEFLSFDLLHDISSPLCHYL